MPRFTPSLSAIPPSLIIGFVGLPVCIALYAGLVGGDGATWDHILQNRLMPYTLTTLLTLFIAAVIMVGTVYLSPEPGAKVFVSVGDKVKKGDTLMLIEAMKTFNPVTADSDGTVKEILVSDSQPVEFGEALIVVE